MDPKSSALFWIGTTCCFFDGPSPRLARHRDLELAFAERKDFGGLERHDLKTGKSLAEIFARSVKE